MGLTLAEIDSDIAETREAISAIRTGAQQYDAAGRKVVKGDLRALQDGLMQLLQLRGVSGSNGRASLVRREAAR